VGIECFLEVGPVCEALAYGLLRRLGIMQVPEAILTPDGSDEHVDVGQYRIAEPRTSHEEIALVVQFLAFGAESDDFRRPSYLVSLNQ